MELAVAVAGLSGRLTIDGGDDVKWAEVSARGLFYGLSGERIRAVAGRRRDVDSSSSVNGRVWGVSSLG